MKEYDVAADAVETIPITTSGDVVKARQAVRTLAQRTGLSLVNQTKLVTAASELGRNTLMYGGGGRARIAVVTQGGRTGVWARFEDEGPGIPDLDLALTDGWTSGSGMGLGLSGARRLVDDFELESAPGKGTTVSVVKWAR
ncbi:anti-sigma regulatory factor [Streptomyces spiroverticillatus]|uniref:Anti-sigma regulatory factor n=1 Tax=Streptomyces finlayi TaxID=67296 RepID=A0A919CCE7_9ACTN|nr:anti-sigma regulatory factor [Streptomyces finlayi]GHA22872.1 anti-sigma regulatory factor [Streptomyces spiroverticillatus]GHD04654.1 anti-sigma regulatory factor [Streptomyces finlayi]